MTIFNQLITLLNRERYYFDDAKKHFERSRLQYIERLNDLKAIVEQMDGPHSIHEAMSDPQELEYLQLLLEESATLFAEAGPNAPAWAGGEPEVMSVDDALMKVIRRRIQMLTMTIEQHEEGAKQ